MASTENFKDFILEQLSQLHTVSARKMFGEYCLYYNEKLVGLIADDRLFIKYAQPIEQTVKTVNLLSPYDGAKPAFYIEQVDDREYLCNLVKTAYEVLPAPKPKKKSKK
ncbi:MAG: TfoX/Sxy family protein [Bacteroidales bacterium]|nr:TfoX/Sxy family protein [Bacteroidales bacterium]